MPTEGTARVDFYPVIHLLTGPPGLARNGGIWKLVKTHLAEISEPPRLMAQCLHFTSYNISLGAWDDWFEPYYDSTRLARELDQTFGQRRDVFVDSGGFQLLYADKMDLTKWGLEVKPSDILEVQAKYRPQRLASLDSPIGPKADRATASKLRKISIDNAAWLAGHGQSFAPAATPYLVVHGRTPDEVRDYLKALRRALPRGWLRRSDYGIALGSQVPLASQPELVVDNAKTTLAWMRTACQSDTRFHVFGVGEGLMGKIAGNAEPTRTVSFDNSTWVQKAFRMRVFDPTTAAYQHYNPAAPVDCACAACARLDEMGPEFVHDLMTRPAYRPASHDGSKVNRSDILALVALHNLDSWRRRLDLPPARLVRRARPLEASSAPERTDYEFPLRQFKPVGDNLLILACSKQRPYRQSRSHQAVLRELEGSGLKESDDFDRVTLSGLFGPVHWTHERHPAILHYDFPLGRLVSQAHKNLLKLRTANVLNVIRRRYDSVVAYLPGKPYREVFAPVIEAFASHVADDVDQVPDLLVSAK